MGYIDIGWIFFFLVPASRTSRPSRNTVLPGIALLWVLNWVQVGLARFTSSYNAGPWLAGTTVSNRWWTFCTNQNAWLPDTNDWYTGEHMPQARPVTIHAQNFSNREGDAVPGDARWARVKTHGRHISCPGEEGCLRKWAQHFGEPERGDAAESTCLFLFFSFFFGLAVQLGGGGSNFPDQGLNPQPRQWERRALITGSPGNSHLCFLLKVHVGSSNLPVLPELVQLSW